MKYFVITFGCQMNVADSEKISSALSKKYKAASSIKEADLVVVNMCSVRQSAVNRIHGLLPKIKGKKTMLTGCILKKDKLKFSKLFDEIKTTEELIKNQPGKSGLVSIMKGCNNFCSYCVVPYTRGREKSRPRKEIICEVKNLVKKGYREIWLLGQNVNSYKYNFPKLLREINKMPGDFIIKFTSSHPKDLSDELIKAVKECKKIANYLNLPVQSGDDEILRKMNRPYTVEQYKDLVRKIRKEIPDIFLSTDVIVGFPSETKKQFENTKKLFKELQFDMAYINKYSPRYGTAAFKLKDNVPQQEKKRREKVLEKIIKEKGKNNKLLVIVGPTASGKTDLSIKIAKRFSGEIISADSRQVYKGMDIGTGKITKKEMGNIPHYLLDVVSPKTRFTVTDFKKKTEKAIKDIQKRNKLPILVGGTGFYIQAVVDGIIIPEVKPDWKLRKELEKKTAQDLFKQLKKLDKNRSENIDKNNKRRLIRAIEIVLKTKKPVPSLKTKPIGSDILILGVKRNDIKELIKKRLLKRIKQGMTAEVKKLHKSGVSWKRLEEFGLEYRYASYFLQGKLSKEEMTEKLQKEIEHFAKRQMTWFKRDKRIKWTKNYKETNKLLEYFLNK
jgi:tRNA dimethylallyltransferase